jgi:hypothetical protein
MLFLKRWLPFPLALPFVDGEKSFSFQVALEHFPLFPSISKIHHFYRRLCNIHDFSFLIPSDFLLSFSLSRRFKLRQRHLFLLAPAGNLLCLFAGRPTSQLC